MFDSLPFMPKEMGPPWLPASVAEARKWAYWGVLVAIIILLIELVASIVFFFVAPIMVVSTVIGLVIGIIIIFIIKATVFDHIDQGRFKDANMFMLIWGILGLFMYVVPGLLILIGFMKLQDVFSPQYQQYQAQPGQVAQPPPQQQSQYQAPPPQQAPPPAPAQQQPPQQQGQEKVEMVKCTKCGVQYPAFMHHCPNCNQPR
jgi:uncharacterized protein with PQ loop repeat